MDIQIISVIVFSSKVLLDHLSSFKEKNRYELLIIKLGDYLLITYALYLKKYFVYLLKQIHVVYKN